MKIAVIPARGGSKRIPRKNIKVFCGHPMLYYAISVAKRSTIFDAIVVSSDDAEILLLAEQLGAKALSRPGELANDKTPTVPVIAHAIETCLHWGWQPTVVCCIYPAVPFLQTQEIEYGLKLLNQKQADYVFPVIAFPTPIQRALHLSPEGKTSSYDKKYQTWCTQDFEKSYYDAGQFYWGKKEAWLSGKNIHADGYAFVVSPWRAIDINTLEDWARAELLQKVFTLEEENYDRNTLSD